MSVFSEHESPLIPPRVIEGENRLRPGQIGALSAIKAHWLRSNEPAIIALPTGYGKTAIHTAVPFMTGASRVLVITSSSLLRSQIKNNFIEMNVLRDCNFISSDIPPPNVHVLDYQIENVSGWEDLRDYEVVVGIPEGMKKIGDSYTAAEEEVIRDLFDLVIIDEAHHSPANTWKELLNIFRSETKKLLATATPFRRDEKRLPGKQIFRYPVSKAKQEGYFAPINLEAVDDVGLSDEELDVEIAQRAEQIFEDDQDKGLSHLLLVRADRIQHAKKLRDIYDEHTNLELALVHSRKSDGKINQILKNISQQTIDGVIGVNMFGEGIDIPRLKISALHDPYSSLPITLQFIGRLARTNETDLGDATVIAPRNELQIGLSDLVTTDSHWNDAIEGLTHFLAQNESDRLEALKNFEPKNVGSYRELTLDSLKPFQHAKVYRVNEFNKSGIPNFNHGCEVIQRYEHQDREIVVLLTQEFVTPKWAKSDAFESVEHHIHIVHYNTSENLLFLSTSHKKKMTYKQLLNAFASDSLKVSTSELNKALRTINRPQFTNVGLQRRLKGGGTESYRIMTGDKADYAVHDSDALRYHRGHFFAFSKESNEDAEGANDPNRPTSLGISGDSKIWSNKYCRLGQLMNWFDTMAEHISRDEEFDVTSSQLSKIPMETMIQSIPESPVISGWWPKEIYQKHCAIRWTNSDGEQQKLWPLVVDIIIPDPADQNSEDDVFTFNVENQDDFWMKLQLNLEEGALFNLLDFAGDETPEISFGRYEHRDWIPIDDYLDQNPLIFYLADHSTLRGHSRVTAPNSMELDFPEEHIKTLDWSEWGVSIHDEKEYEGDEEIQSIHEFIGGCFGERWDVVYYDDGSYEIADFLAFRSSQDGSNIIVKFIHCKSARNNDEPGSRVKDFYDVVGQTVRSLQHVHDLQGLQKHIRGREKKCNETEFIVGNMKILENLIQAGYSKEEYFVDIVQPALKGDRISTEVAQLLAGAKDTLKSRGCESLIVWASS